MRRQLAFSFLGILLASQLSLAGEQVSSGDSVVATGQALSVSRPTPQVCKRLKIVFTTVSSPIAVFNIT